MHNEYVYLVNLLCRLWWLFRITGDWGVYDWNRLGYDGNMDFKKGAPTTHAI